MTKNQITWTERFKIALYEELTISDIMKLLNVGKPRATHIRNEIIKYCIQNNIKLPTSQIPTELFFIITNKNIEYYFEKMRYEKMAI